MFMPENNLNNNNTQSDSDGFVSIASYTIFQAETLERLLQAIINGDKQSIHRILSTNPELLIEDPKDNLIINRKMSGQSFFAELPLKMAVKSRQVDIVKILLQYFETLETTNIADGKIHALNQFKPPFIVGKNMSPFVSPNQKIRYAEKMDSIVESILRETYLDPDTKQLIIGVRLKLDHFQNAILRKEAMSLDSLCDIEELLFSAYEAYVDYFYEFQNEQQRALFCTHIIGFLQNLLSREVIEHFDMYRTKQVQNENAQWYEMQDLNAGEPLADQFLTGFSGGPPNDFDGGADTLADAIYCANHLRKICDDRAKEFDRLWQALNIKRWPRDPEPQSFSCSII